MGIIQVVKDWLRANIRPKFKTVIVEEDIPDKPKYKVLYIVTEDGVPWSAAMVCPCGCGETLHMNLLPDERPVWSLVHHGNNLSSLHPSIWRQVGCKSHFWFRHGQIYWTKEQSRTILKDLHLWFR
jgi:hypothetical protein